MRSVVHGMRRRLSLPLFIGTFAIAGFMASTSLASANEVVIGLPATPPPSGFDLTAPEDDTPDPPAPDQPFDFTDGDGGDPNPPFPQGPDDVVDGDGGDPEPTPPTGPGDFTDGDGGEPTDVPEPEAEEPLIPEADLADPQTFDAAVPLANVVALPVTGAGNGSGQDHSELAPLFVLLSAACLLGTGLLTSNPRSGNHARNR